MTPVDRAEGAESARVVVVTPVLARDTGYSV